LKALVIIFLTVAIFGSAMYATWRLYLKPRQALHAEKARGPASPPPDYTLPEFQKRLAAQDTMSITDARKMWADFVERFPDSGKLDEAKDYLGRLNVAVFLSPVESPEKTVYVVKPGDVITRVAGKFKTTPELLMRANNMQGPKASMLRIGQKLLISPSDFTVTIDRRKKRVALMNTGKFFKQYHILGLPAPKTAPNGKVIATPRPPKISGKVTDRIPWVNGQRVSFAEKEFASAYFWIIISPAGHSLYCEHPPTNGPPPLMPKPTGGGYLLGQEDLREMAALLKKNDPVTID
jgi:LysM repeat protein